MVTVDMSKTRQQISKRKRRLRRLQRRRLQKVRRQQHAQLVAAGAARKARQKAVQNWLEEEKRREGEPHNQSSGKQTRVRFADNVYVTEIPTVPTHSLPKPVSSPTGVRLVRDKDECRANDATLLGADDGVRFSFLSAYDDDYDEDDDPDFVPDVLAEHADIQLPVATRPKRRIIPQPVSVSNSADSKPTKHQENASPSSSLASTPPKASAPHNTLNQSTEHSNEASPPKFEAVAKSSKRKRTHSQMLSTQKGTSPNASPEVDDDKTSPTKTSDSPRRRKKKKRKLSNMAQADQNAEHQPKSPTPDDDRSSPKKAQSVAGQPHSGTESPQLSSIHATDEGNKQNGAVANGDSGDSDIDAMFGQMVRRKAQVRAEQRNRKNVDKANDDKLVSEGDKGKVHKRKGPTRYTEEGFRIMSYDDIRADQPAGLNGECPFDCSCCF